jgi:hypothetical protein
VANAARAALERRDDAIRAALADGASLRDVADMTGLSHGGVAKVRDRDRRVR